MSTVTLSLEEIGDLATHAFSHNGCNAANTEALVRTVVTAERDGSLSHGLFRVPGYVASLRSGDESDRCRQRRHRRDHGVPPEAPGARGLAGLSPGSQRAAKAEYVRPDPCTYINSLGERGERNGGDFREVAHR